MMMGDGDDDEETDDDGDVLIVDCLLSSQKIFPIFTFHLCIDLYFTIQLCTLHKSSGS